MGSAFELHGQGQILGCIDYSNQMTCNSKDAGFRNQVGVAVANAASLWILGARRSSDVGAIHVLPSLQYPLTVHSVTSSSDYNLCHYHFMTDATTAATRSSSLWSCFSFLQVLENILPDGLNASSLSAFNAVNSTGFFTITILKKSVLSTVNVQTLPTFLALTDLGAGKSCLLGKTKS